MRDEPQANKRAEESNAAGARAAAMRNSPGASSAGPIGEPAEGVLTLVCLTCGTEYHFDDQDPPEGMSCEKCGSDVFRSFFSPVANDEATEDFENSTQRDLDPDDAEGDAAPGDVLDLNRD